MTTPLKPKTTREQAKKEFEKKIGKILDKHIYWESEEIDSMPCDVDIEVGLSNEGKKKIYETFEHLLDQQRKEIMDSLNPKSKENQRSAKKLCNRWFKPTKKQSADYVVRNFGEVIKRLANE